MWYVFFQDYIEALELPLHYIEALELPLHYIEALELLGYLQ